MLTFPIHLFNPAVIKLAPMGASIAGGESLSGETDTIRTDGGGFWVARMLGIELRTPDLIRAWRAWEDHLEDGVQRVIVPIADLRQAPRPVAGGRLASPSALADQSSDPYFPEALGFATPFVVAKVTLAAALRATQLKILVERGQRLKGGETFSIDHPIKGRRLYRVGRIVAHNGYEATCTIRPPLREAVALNAAVDFDWPSFVGKLSPEADISPEISYGTHGTVDITFMEAF